MIPRSPGCGTHIRILMCNRHCDPGHAVRYVEVVRLGPGTKGHGASVSGLTTQDATVPSQPRFRMLKP